MEALLSLRFIRKDASFPALCQRRLHHHACAEKAMAEPWLSLKFTRQPRQEASDPWLCALPFRGTAFSKAVNKPLLLTTIISKKIVMSIRIIVYLLYSRLRTEKSTYRADDTFRTALCVNRLAAGARKGASVHSGRVFSRFRCISGFRLYGKSQCPLFQHARPAAGRKYFLLRKSIPRFRVFGFSSCSTFSSLYETCRWSSHTSGSSSAIKPKTRASSTE